MIDFIEVLGLPSTPDYCIMVILNREREMVMNKMKSFALVPVLVIAGIVAVHMMMAVAVVSPMPVA